MVEDEGDVFGWTPSYLTTNSGRLVELAIRLPTIDEPRFDLQLIAGKNLDAHSVEEPRSVGRNERRLVSPIIEVIETPKSDVRQKYSRINVDAMHLVYVITTVSLRDVAISVIK